MCAFFKLPKGKQTTLAEMSLECYNYTNCHSLVVSSVYLHTKRTAPTRYIYRWVWYVHTFQSFVYSCNVRYSTKRRINHAIDVHLFDRSFLRCAPLRIVFTYLYWPRDCSRSKQLLSVMFLDFFRPRKRSKGRISEFNDFLLDLPRSRQLG